MGGLIKVSQFFELLCDMFPEGNTMPTCNYDAKKILCPMDMEYKKIHACPNDCVLYRKQFENLHQCPQCGVSRYKKKDGDSEYDVRKGVPTKVLWHFPIIQRFTRLFTNANDAKLIRWCTVPFPGVAQKSKSTHGGTPQGTQGKVNRSSARGIAQEKTLPRKTSPKQRRRPSEDIA